MVTVTDVKLPTRTRARLEAESNQQRVLKPHDIRGAIPLVDYTNPAKFPPYVFREYPKMPLLDGNKPITIDESGGVLVFYDAADEVEFKDMNPEIADEIERNTPSVTLANAIAAKDQQLEDMRARLRAAGLDDSIEERKPVKNALKAAVRPSVPPAGKSTEKAPEAKDEPGGGGLAAQVKAAEAAAETGKPGKPANPLQRKRN